MMVSRNFDENIRTIRAGRSTCPCVRQIRSLPGSYSTLSYQTGERFLRSADKAKLIEDGPLGPNDRWLQGPLRGRLRGLRAAQQAGDRPAAGLGRVGPEPMILALFAQRLETRERPSTDTCASPKSACSCHSR